MARNAAPPMALASSLHALAVAATSVLARLSDRWQRLALDVQFAIVGSVVVAIFMTLLGAWVSDRIVKGVIDNSAANAALYLHGLVEPHVQELAERRELSPATLERIDALFEKQRMRGRILGVKIWAAGGYLVYSRDRGQIGRVFPETAPLKEAWRGHVATEYDHLNDEENDIERKLALPVLEIYSPVFRASDNEVVAVAEIYEVANDLKREMRASYAQTSLAVAGLTLLMIASLFQIVRRGARTISQQKTALSQRVEELSSSLELNTVLQRRVADANRRAAEANEHFLRQIGAELHDGPAQLISLGLLRLDALRPRGPLSGKQQKAIDHDFGIVRGALADSLKELRSICAGITIPELRNSTLPDALRVAVSTHSRRTGTEVTLVLDPALPDGVPLPFVVCAYRFVQEGLNNAFRHADGAGQRVTAHFIGQSLLLTVSDDGPGMCPAEQPQTATTGQLGLRGLRDRILAMGGSFDITSSAESGTQLTAIFNFEELGFGHA